jgi:AraC-like DNA-binding protein
MVIERSSVLSIAIPRSRIVPRLASADSLRRTLSLRDPAAHLLNSYGMALLDVGGSIAAREQKVFADHIADLAVLMLGAKRDEGEGARQRGARAARYAAIVADIGKNLHHPELSLGWVAGRHKVSPAYIRALFADKGTSFTDHVLDARLDRACALLRSQDAAQGNIARLALMAGFGDISWFNKAFRRRFGMTPSDFRAGGSVGK